MINDSLSDMITRIRNAHLVQKQDVFIPTTKMNLKVAELLQQEGFIQSFEEMDTNHIRIALRYKENKAKPYITKLIRVSKPGLRVYTNKNEIPKVLGGIGIALISTSQGIMTDRQARMENIGGEVLCYVW
jgi:small subunit ribosomal protein S8|tara:strand:+ start:9664 stop:10053 length:390 start_codon:yes stop_codon:yes gene_type:complete